jgi:adenylosuccinate lyase
MFEILDKKELSKRYQLNSQADFDETENKLDQIINEFDLDSAKIVKDKENKINHDVKAVEYFIKEEMKSKGLNESIYELVHFCCTSEDINNLAWGLIIKDSLNFVYNQKLTFLINRIARLAEDTASIAMMSKTHGQPATPTTMGKELANFAYRINEQHYNLKGLKIKGKINGAVGNFNAHLMVLPDVNWLNKSQMFIERLGLEWNPFTTQIENHDSICEYFNYISLINTILIGMSRDMWGYISSNYFTQKLKNEEVGSSTMPHKVNPIDFENAEGNLGLANSILSHLSSKLPISRFQRDLSDSTVLRNIGNALGYSILAYSSLEKGLNKLEINKKFIENELNSHWELLAEPIQTVMRFNGYQNPYEILKDHTRGKTFSQESYNNFIDNLNLPEKVKVDLKNLSPKTYTGNAEYMAKNIRDFLK